MGNPAVGQSIPGIVPVESAASVFKTYWGLPIPIWGAFISCLCMIVGWQWDICWHRSIGRDTLWTLPHIAIYIALAVAFVYNAWLVLGSTAGRWPDVEGIRVIGFVGPAGSFLTLCGILLQFLAIVWDDWWHNIYGLDIGVFSPPHSLIAYGINLFYIGQFFLLASYRNRGLGGSEKTTRWAAVIVWSFFLGHMAIGAEDAYGPAAVRSHAWVHSSATVFPIGLIVIQSYLKWRWAAPAAAGLYMLGTIVLMQIFQLFPATPQFGPVFHRVPHFLPPSFPLPLVVPALILAPFVSWAMKRKGLKSALMLGLVFVIAFNAANFTFSHFLATPAADNGFFAGGYPGSVFEEDFRPVETVGWDGSAFLTFGIALILATLSSWFSLYAGQWLRRVVR